MIKFAEFLKNPVVGMLFMCLMAIAYLYYDNRTTLTNQIVSLQKQVDVLTKENNDLKNQIINIYKELNK
jgi:cell division protein FtsB